MTSTSKTGLEAAVQKIEEMMKQELPNLVDERRFRRRDQEQVERDEFGRVSYSRYSFGKYPLTLSSVNGPRRRYRSTSKRSVVLTSELKLLGTVVRM